MLPHGLDAGGSDLPMRLAFNVTAHVLTANEGDVLAEARAVPVDQALAVLGLLVRLLVETRV